jgi:hypothetical protein
MQRWKTRTITGLALLALGGTACATAKPALNERLAASEASTRGAHEAGAENEPQAKLHLKMAQDQIVLARKLQKDKPEEAARLLERAKADAELAVGLTRAGHAQREAQATLAQIETLQSNPQ